MNRQGHINSIIGLLTWLSNRVEVNNRLNLTDINIHSENFYRDFLNLAFDYQLENTNLFAANSAAIDLADKLNRICVQVTSTSGLPKTKKTVMTFISKGLYAEFDRLVILNIAGKAVHKEPSIGDHNFALSTKDDIWDVGDLAKKINNLELSRITKIAEFLTAELQGKPSEELPKNVSTILRLIELISDEDHSDVGLGFVNAPDPDGKINKRFADHSDFLKSEYTRLFIEYGAVFDAVRRESDIGPVKLRRAAEHLRVYSDQVLTGCGGDPKMALDQIIAKFSSLLTANGFQADTGAVQFYIINELTRCNVFPNRGVNLV